MFYQLPPVGNPVRLSGSEQLDSFLQAVFAPYQPRYYASGTAALAAAIGAAVQFKGVTHPEVVLPAYGCPDLVSATVFAGARPVLCDLESDRPWMNLDQLSARISSQTVAIVATHLFGISERMNQLRPIAEQAGAVLIEDSAQVFPDRTETSLWDGDLVVLSFGRGKPVSLLGGGAVLFRGADLGDRLLERDARERARQHQRLSFQLKVMLYNLLISPRVYWIPQALPFLHLGETRFHPLSSIDAIDAARLAKLPTNVCAYQIDDMKAQKGLASMLAELDLSTRGIIDLTAVCGIPTNRRLLRYPLLVNAKERHRLYAELRRRGLGSSGMYPATLPGISGLKELLAGQGPFPAAETFAAGILTLPTHNRVGSGDIAEIRRVIATH